METILRRLNKYGLAFSEVDHIDIDRTEVETRLSFYADDLPDGSIHLQYPVNITAKQLKGKLLALANLIPD